MRKKERILILLSAYIWGTFILFFLGTSLGYLGVLLALIYLFVGGRRHV